MSATALAVSLLILIVVMLAVPRGRLPILVVCLVVLVPFQATPSVHPAVIAIGGSLLWLLATRPANLLKSITQARVAMLGVCIFFVFLVMSSGLMRTFFSYNSLYLVVVPIGLYLVSADTLSVDANSRLSVTRGVALLASVESVLAILQYVTKNLILFHEAYSVSSFYVYSQGWRSPGTLDHPLLLGYFLAGAIPLLRSVNTPIYRGVGVLLFLGGILVSGSRSALVAGLVGAIFVVVSTAYRPASRFVATAGLIAVIVPLVASPVGQGVLGRFANDSGSALARELGQEAFLEILPHRVLVGSGLASNYRIAESLGLYSSFENAFFMLAVDVGIVGALAFYVSHVLLILRGVRRQKGDSGARVGAGVLLILTLTFSSIGTVSAAPFLLWFFVALATCCVTQEGELGSEGSRFGVPGSAVS